MKRVLLVVIFLLESCSIDNSRLFPADSGTTNLEDVTIEPQEFVLLSGGNSSCYLYENGAIRCWGELIFRSAQNQNLQKMSLGQDFACGFDSLGSPYCLYQVKPKNPKFLLPLPVKHFRPSIVVILTFVALMLVGNSFCWGDNIIKQVEIPSSILGKSFVSIHAGSFHNCAISSDSRTYCTG